MGHEVMLVSDWDPRMADGEILQRAARDGHVVVTNDKDFGRHIVWRQVSPVGLVRLPNGPGLMLVELLRQVLAHHQEDLAQGAIVIATRNRIRVRQTRQD